MGPQYRPQNTIVLIMGAPKKEPLILGSPQINLNSTPHGRGSVSVGSVETETLQELMSCTIALGMMVVKYMLCHAGFLPSRVGISSCSRVGALPQQPKQPACVLVCMYMYLYVYIYICEYIPTYIHTYIRTYIHTYIHTYTHTYIHTYMHT